MSTLAGRYGLIFPAIYMAVIFGISSIPGSDNPKTAIRSFFLSVPVNVQNFLHVPVFGGLCLVWRLALEAKVENLGWRTMLGVALTVLYGFMDELHQSLVPGRFATLPDMILDALGAFMAAIYYAMFRTPRQVRLTD